MPFRNTKGLDLETLRNSTQAFDAVCDRLKLTPDGPERGKLAITIVELASRGERDPAMLFALAVDAMD